MISNRYYISTIIAIFLSLSLGILIGGTLGQQWISQNQQKLITHYEAKAEDVKILNKGLNEKQEELARANKELKEDYKQLFINSVKGAINGQKILWINDTEQSFESLRKTIELAGAVIFESAEKEVSRTTAFDVVLFFPTNQEALPDYNWLLEYNVPVIYVTDQANPETINLDLDIELFEQRINVDSLNEHFNFIFFLKNLPKEMPDE